MLKIKHPFEDLPAPGSLPPAQAFRKAPDEEQCFALWRKYEMLDNIRRHSLLVAHIATQLAIMAKGRGIDADVEGALAAGLLHDIAKTWCIKHQGSHAMLGAAWTARETGCPHIAQGVLLHVHWPWRLPAGDAICCLPVFVLYADKRARHDQCVTLKERFEDLLARYGKTDAPRVGIRQSFEQAKIIEAALSERLKRDLHEYTFDCGRLVQRA